MEISMERIIQKTPYSCGIASVQMVTSLPEKTIISLLGYSPDDINPINRMPFGVSEIELVSVMFNMGFNPIFIVTREYLLHTCNEPSILHRVKISACLPSQEDMQYILKDNVAILCLIDHHMVVWNKSYIFDPDENKPGKRNYSDYDVCAAIFVPQSTDGFSGFHTKPH